MTTHLYSAVAQDHPFIGWDASAANNMANSYMSPFILITNGNRSRTLISPRGKRIFENILRGIRFMGSLSLTGSPRDSEQEYRELANNKTTNWAALP